MPLFDMEGKPDNTLAEALGLTPAGERHASGSYFLALNTEGWLAPHAEVSTHYAQFLHASRGEILLKAATTGESCGFDIQLAAGRAVIISGAYPSDISLFRTILEKLGARAGLVHDCEDDGLFMTTSATESGERLLHILNLDGFEKEFHISEHGQPLFEGRLLHLRGREGMMLPLNLSLDDTRIAYSTAELIATATKTIQVHLTQPQDIIAFTGPRNVVPGHDYDVERHGTLQLVIARKPAVLDDQLTIHFE
ncbi:hypothetical protein [Dictyobacter kobayashii]|uniref:Uncharacterized protein n=1 Tax=Dictyobacter kobayashii TaxID=2014872 RepID=A0A402ASE2_9CHLR|nr:hypothetical protein [Dictyobacter kobayashii]GCE22014.1 hypothetical protein KDK_58140 [Dictyobacter kobayashii]